MKTSLLAAALLFSANAFAASVHLTDADDGITVDVPAGQSVVLDLASNPTTGYSWEVVQTDRTFGYPTEKFIGSGSGAIGAGGTQEFTWNTTSPLNLVGEHTVKLDYRRPWDAAHPAKTFTFTVNVVGAPAHSTVYITFTDNGGHFSVKQGQDVAVQLQSNPSTGYAWEVTQTDRSFGYPAQKDFVASGHGVGAGGIETLTWKTNTPFALGTHTVTLEYRRPWDTSDVAQTFTFTVTVSR